MTNYLKGIGIKSFFQKDLGNQIVKCTACYHHCIIEPGQRGICGIRHNYKGNLYSLVNTRPCSIALDPIEKKPLYHFYPGTTIFSMGTVGCNMRCSWCQNWTISQASKGSDYDIEDVSQNLQAYNLTAEEAVNKALERGCKSIAYTYNEPTIFADMIYDTAKFANSKGMKNVLVTNGYQSIECIHRLAPYIDACNIDLKTGRNAMYSKYCGTRLTPILRNIKIWHKLGVHVEVTTLIIPGENESDEELTWLANFLAEISPNIVWHLSAYYDCFRMGGKGRTPKETLMRGYEIGKKAGLNYVYLGNVSSQKHATTFCNKCGNKIVDRGFWGRGGKITGLNKKGKCKKCGNTISGYWNDSIRNLDNPKTTTIPKELYEVKLDSDDDEMTDENDEKLPIVKILFATQTGVSEELAQQVKKEGEKVMGNFKNKFRIKVLDMETFDETKLAKEKYVVVVTSTFFYGRIPRNGERFLNYLRNCKSGSLKGVNFAVLGVGSTGTKEIHLKTYMVISREIDKLFNDAGAKRIITAGECNKKKDFYETLDAWKTNFWKNLEI